MPRVRDILGRFRPAGAPGGATSAGVPVDRQAMLSDELEPVFQHLQPVLRECARIRREATDEAHRRTAAANSRAHDIVARARTESEAERAAAAAAARATVAAQSERSLARAREQAHRVRLEGEQRRPRLVQIIVDQVRADLRAMTNDSAEAGREHGGGGP